MSNTIIPNNPNQPSTSPLPGNVGSLANPDTLSNLSNSKPPITFGNQIQDQAKQQVIKAATNDPLANLYKEQAALNQEGIQLNINYRLELFKLDQQRQLYQTLSQANTSISNVTPDTSAAPSQLTGNVTNEDTTYVGDTSWKGQTPDKDHGLRQCKSNYNGSCDVIWDGYIHNYVSQTLWEQKFKTSVPSNINGNDNTDPNPKSAPPATSAGITDEQYKNDVNTADNNYNKAQAKLTIRKEANQKSIDDLLKDPFKKQKDENKKNKNRLKKRRKKLTEDERKAKKQKNKQVFQNSKKSLVAILTLTLTNQISNIIAQNGKIGKLVDDTNEIITSANESGDETKLQNAKVARDNAIKIIQDNEAKIIKIRDQINRISIFINIFNVIVNALGPTLLGIPTPSPAPDLVTPPKEIFRRKVYEPALRLLNTLSALLPIISATLDRAISILEDYKSQLLDINGKLDESANFSTLSGPGGLNGGGFGTISETYKGFRFAIREDNSFGGIQVGNFKRHYAVAIDINNVDILKSELSFTLDPDDLISQLKLVIDQQGLFTGDGTSSLDGNPNNPNTSTPGSQNQSNNPNLPSSIVPSVGSINTLQKTSSTPPKSLVVVAPGGTTAQIPLSPIDKARITALAAASGPNPQPKIDLAFLLAADKKWKNEYKAWQSKLSSGISGIKS